MKLQFSLIFCMSLFMVFPVSIIRQTKAWSELKVETADNLKSTIFPNPLKNKILNIESSSDALKHIKIYDVLGEKKYINDTYEDRIFLDDLNTGIYLF